MSEVPPSRERLGHELRRLRGLAGLTGQVLVNRLGLPNQVAVTRIENGTRKITRGQVHGWADEAGASAEERETLLRLLDAAVQEESLWAQRLAGRGHFQDEIRAYEYAARVVRNFQPSIIPGLLQTPEYAQYIIPRVDLQGDVNHEQALARRLARQQILYEPGRQFEFLLTEAALAWPASQPGLLAAQLDRIATVAQWDAVTVRVLQLGEPPDVVGWNNFVMYEGDELFVHTELVHPVDPLADLGNVELYQLVWSRLWEPALSGEAMLGFLRTTAAELRDQL